MSRLHPFTFTLFALILFPASAGAQEHHHQVDGGGTPEFGELGSVDFPVTCSGEELQRDFNRAVALYSHMTYPPARDIFLSIADRDPQCAMAFWGVAMTLIHPVWPETPTAEILTEGAEYIARARALAENATERERLYIEAAAALYDEWNSVPYAERLEKWSDAQEKVYRAHPEDDEAAALYALALVAVGDSRATSDYSLHLKAAEILEEVFTRKADHPGVVHYAIHAYDKPSLAERAVPFARAYGDIAPNVPHALHMPTHIFTRLGYWNDSKSWNDRSRIAAIPLTKDGRVHQAYLHAADYLVYAHLQTGHEADAKSVVGLIEADGPYFNSFASAYAFAAIPARIALESRNWGEAARLEPRWDADDPDFNWAGFEPCEAVTQFARGVGGARGGNLEAAREAIDAIRELQGREGLGQRPFWQQRMEIQVETVEALIAYAEGEHQESLNRLRRLSDREDELGKSPVMPSVVSPVREILGDLLLERGQYAAALEAYETNLGIRPGRFNSLGGAGRAAEKLGRDEVAEAHYSALLELAGDGDTARPDVGYARSFLDRASDA